MKKILIVIIALFTIITCYGQNEIYKYKLNYRTGKFDLVRDSIIHTDSIFSLLAEYDTIRFENMNPYSISTDTIPTIDIDSIAIDFDSISYDLETFLNNYTFSDSLIFDSIVSVLGKLYIDGELYVTELIVGDSNAVINLDGIPENSIAIVKGDSLTFFSGFTFNGTTLSIEQGTDNVFIGEEAGTNIGAGTDNTFLGDHAGYTNPGYGYNTYIGSDAGYYGSANYNTAIGWQALYHSDNATATYNIALGTQAGFGNSNPGTILRNIFIGHQSGYGTNPIGDDNIFIGYQSGYSYTLGAYNTFIGNLSGNSNTTGSLNVYLGYNTGASATTGIWNTSLGAISGYSLTTGDSNVFVGSYSGYMNDEGNRNVYIGTQAGHENQTGNGNVFIGFECLYNSTGSDILAIENSSSATPLIHGDFSADTLRINGDLSVSGDLNVYGSFTGISSGSSGYIQLADGSGGFTSNSKLTYSSNTLGLGTIAANGLEFINSNNYRGIYGQNTAGGYGIYISNSGSGQGVYGYNISSGNGLYGFNSGSGNAIRAYCNSSGRSLYASSTSSGVNTYIYGTNTSSGDLLRINGAGTSNLLVLQDSLTNVLVVDSTGKLEARKYLAQLDAKDSTATIAATGVYYTFNKWREDTSVNVTVTDSTLTTTTDGFYYISMGASFSGINLATLEVDIFINDVINDVSIGFERKLSDAGDVGDAGKSGMLYLNSGDVVKLKIKSDVTGTLTGNRANLSIHKIN